MMKHCKALILSCLITALSFNAGAASAQTPPGTNTDQSKGPVIVHALQARYPPQAIRNRHQGIANVLVTVDADGHAVSARIQQSSGYPELDKAAIEAALKSQYLPYLKNDIPTKSTLTLPITFDAGHGFNLGK